MQENTELGNRIKDARLESNLTQKELANKLNCSVMMISRYELGKVNPPIPRLKKIAQICKKEPKYFLEKTAPSSTKLHLPNKKHIVFDFDDTISSSYELNQQLFYETFLPHSDNLDESYIRNLHRTSKGLSMLDQFQTVIDHFEIKVSAEKLVLENEEIHKKRAGDMTIFEGVEEILSYFRRNAKVISICTNRNKGSLDLILKKYDLEKYFDNVISCVDLKHEKPDPYCLTELIKKYPRISKEEYIYFGDSKTDAEFATNAGIDFLIINHYLNNKKFYALSLQSFATIEDELLLEVDRKDEEIGAIYKNDAHSDPDKYHRAAHIVVFTSQGNIVLQKRGKDKRYDPLRWDIPGGHQAFGITMDQTAESELNEELGIKSTLTFVRKGLKQDNKQSEFYYLFNTVHNGPYFSDLREVEEIKEFDCEKILSGEYDKKYKILPHVYEYVKEMSPLWRKLQSGSSGSKA